MIPVKMIFLEVPRQFTHVRTVSITMATAKPTTRQILVVLVRQIRVKLMVEEGVALELHHRHRQHCALTVSTTTATVRSIIRQIRVVPAMPIMTKLMRAVRHPQEDRRHNGFLSLLLLYI
jgi:hypothetical protein